MGGAVTTDIERRWRDLARARAARLAVPRPVHDVVVARRHVSCQGAGTETHCRVIEDPDLVPIARWGADLAPGRRRLVRLRPDDVSSYCDEVVARLPVGALICVYERTIKGFRARGRARIKIREVRADGVVSVDARISRAADGTVVARWGDQEVVFS